MPVRMVSLHRDLLIEQHRRKYIMFEHRAERAAHAVQEAQRMYSVAPLVVRKALQDVRIGQYTIPKGTAMILHIFAMHNTSANYERHAEFLPVRHSP